MFKMLHTNRGELQLLFDTFCRVWGAGGQATLTTTTQGGELKANLEIQVGSPSSLRPGAPPTSSTAFSSSQRLIPGHPGAVAHHRRRRRPRHRGPAAKARSRARAAAHQASLAAASSTTPPVSMSCASAASDGALPLSPPACPLISFEAPSAPAPGATLPSPSAAPAELPPAPQGPPTHSSPAPGGAQPPPFDPEEEGELEMVRPCVVCVIARWPPGRSPVSAVTEYILNKADMENGDPMGMLESVLYCDQHSVTLL